MTSKITDQSWIWSDKMSYQTELLLCTVMCPSAQQKMRSRSLSLPGACLTKSGTSTLTDWLSSGTPSHPLTYYNQLPSSSPI